MYEVMGWWREGSGGKQACPLPVDRDRLGLEVSTVNRPENCSLTEEGGGGSRRAPEAPPRTLHRFTLKSSAKRAVYGRCMVSSMLFFGLFTFNSVF